MERNASKTPYPDYCCITVKCRRLQLGYSGPSTWANTKKPFLGPKWTIWAQIWTFWPKLALFWTQLGPLLGQMAHFLAKWPTFWAHSQNSPFCPNWDHFWCKIGRFCHWQNGLLVVKLSAHLAINWCGGGKIGIIIIGNFPLLYRKNTQKGQFFAKICLFGVSR